MQDCGNCRLLKFGGDISLEPDNYTIQIQTETVSAAKRFYTLLKEVFDIHAKIDVRRNEFLKEVEIIR